MCFQVYRKHTTIGQPSIDEEISSVLVRTDLLTYINNMFIDFFLGIAVLLIFIKFISKFLGRHSILEHLIVSN